MLELFSGERVMNKNDPVEAPGSLDQDERYLDELTELVEGWSGSTLRIVRNLIYSDPEGRISEAFLQLAGMELLIKAKQMVVDHSKRRIS